MAYMQKVSQINASLMKKSHLELCLETHTQRNSANREREREKETEKSLFMHERQWPQRES